MYNQPTQLWRRILKSNYLDTNNDERILTIKNPPKGLAIWSLMMSYRHVIEDDLSWHVGNR